MTRRIRSLRAVITVLSLLIPARGALAQVRDNPPRPMPRAAPTGVVSGRAELQGTGQPAVPVRRARVVLTGGTGDPLVGQTDITGRFEFAKLVDGDYRVTVEKSGFVTLRPPSVAIVRNGSPAAETVVTMGPGAAISGRVTDARGDPLKGELVALDRLDAGGGRRRSEFSATSDALGHYRIHTLPAGNYQVHARAGQPEKDELYYPGTARSEDSPVLQVTAGAAVEAIDFVLTAVPKDAPSFQSIQPVAAPRALSLPPGMGRLSGRVTRSDGTFVPNALVKQASMNGQGSAMRADNGGQFEFRGMPDGVYALVAQTPEFANAHLSAFQSFSGAPLMTLSEGRSVENIQLVAAEGMTIEGRVVDEFGDPVPGVHPQLAIRAVIREHVQLVPMGDSGSSGVTDDRGGFQFFQVAPGDYYIQVMSKPFFDSAEGPFGFAPTYFSNTDQMADARPIHVEKGVDVRDVVMPLVTANTLSVSGRVVELAGQPVSKPRVQLIRMQAGVPTTTALAEGGTDGAFTFDDVPPGTYVVHVRTADASGTVSLTLSGATGELLAPFTVVMQPLSHLAGHVVLDGAPEQSPPSGLRIVAMATDLPILAQAPATPVGADGGFVLGVRAGPGLVRTMMPGLSWVLETVRLNGADVTTTPFDLQKAIGGDLEVILSNRLGSIAGRVVDQRNVVPDVLVGVVPEDRSKWTSTATLPLPVSTNLQGGFVFSGLFPGRYLVFTFKGLLGELDRAQIESLAPFATPVVVTEGQEASIEFTLRPR